MGAAAARPRCTRRGAARLQPEAREYRNARIWNTYEHVVGSVGTGKTKLAGGQLQLTAGAITVLGGRPAGTPAQLAKVGFVAHDTPVYAGLTVAEHLRLGAQLNPRWDEAMARERITQLGLDPAHRAGKLSGGQRAQLALTLSLAKRPELLILDEPVASLAADLRIRRGDAETQPPPWRPW
ncbi:ATP-binding cassette domain-containing protein [Nonomuraea zeae]|uniref:ATP-binding cassette domain-containing protein n=1 Tax=Nonomuraea zeae TaxID=1642303 RepID=UPI001F0EFBAD|nr:ATP-binding cassette domain-containing protein [Nonomuraea zeae]